MGPHAAELHDLVGKLTTLTERLTALRDHLTHSDPEAAAETGFATRGAAARELSEAAARLARCADLVTVTSTQIARAAELPIQDGCRSDRLWLAQQSGINNRAAAAIVRAGEAETRYPLVAAAFEDGRIQLGHIDAVTTIIPGHFKGDTLHLAVAMIQDLQPRLIDAAQQMCVDDFAKLCRGIRIRLDADGPADRSADASTAWLEETLDGRWMLSGDLSADDGALIATMLLERMEKIRQRLRKHADADPTFVMPTERELRAMALLELLTDGAGANRPGRVGVFLHIDLEDLGVDGDELDDLLAGKAHTEADLDISDTTLWDLLAGADVTPVFNHEGTPLCYGRTRRLAPEILRHIIAHRDRRCRWPHCNQPAMRCHNHHLEHWENGGGTDPPGIVALCRFHHLAHHNHGWGVAPPDDPTAGPRAPLHVTRPDGTPLLDRAEQRRRQEREHVLARF